MLNILKEEHSHLMVTCRETQDNLVSVSNQLLVAENKFKHSQVNEISLKHQISR